MDSRTLIVARLTVQSSYLRNEEHPATVERFDTIQWWLGGIQGWRIRTFAIDLDIHLHQFDPIPDCAAFAVSTTATHYGEVLDSLVTLELADYHDDASVNRVCREVLGSPGLEYSTELEMGFWNPGQLFYRSQSQPN